MGMLWAREYGGISAIADLTVCVDGWTVGVPSSSGVFALCHLFLTMAKSASDPGNISFDGVDAGLMRAMQRGRDAGDETDDQCVPHQERPDGIGDIRMFSKSTRESVELL